MQRKLARERAEYLHAKAREGRKQAQHESKRKLKSILENEETIPRSMRDKAQELFEEMRFDDAETEPRTHVDDEYAKAGIQDPKVLVTTSHNPTQKLKEFAKELRLLFPNAQRINRGSESLAGIITAAREHEFTDLVITNETRGVPDALVIMHLPYGPTFSYTLYNVVTRHDIPDVGPMSEQYPNLVFEGFTTPLGKRLSDGLKYLYPVVTNPTDTTRVMVFDNNQDWIAFRHYTYEKKGKKAFLQEAGPRFEMRPYKITLGTLDMPDADVEWTLKPYMNNAKRKKLL